jgi:sensor histidine kinase YesM
MNTENRHIFNRHLDFAPLTRHRLLLHVLFWSCYLIYEILIWGMVEDAYQRRLISQLIELPVKLAAIYFTIYVLIDRFLIPGKYKTFLILLFSSAIFFGVVLRVLAYHTIYPMFYPEATNAPLFYWPKILISIFYIYTLAAVAGTFHIIRHWYKHQQATQLLEQTAQQLEKEKLDAELKLLKSQINPHFLFNTLNNLYALTLNQPSRAPEMVYKLSQLMNYMMYDGNQTEVPLEKEIRYIENYIALEKIRYDNHVDVSLNVYDNVEGIMIAPLLLLPFVENSFKHGLSNRISGGWVRIEILLQGNMLVMKVENSKSVPEKEKSIKPVSGIGLRNVKKRLELIYPERYNLQIMDDEETFLVVLKIQLEGRIRKQRITEKEYNPAL